MIKVDLNLDMNGSSLPFNFLFEKSTRPNFYEVYSSDTMRFLGILYSHVSDDCSLKILDHKTINKPLNSEGKFLRNLQNGVYNKELLSLLEFPSEQDLRFTSAKKYLSDISINRVQIDGDYSNFNFGSPINFYKLKTFSSLFFEKAGSVRISFVFSDESITEPFEIVLPRIDIKLKVFSLGHDLSPSVDMRDKLRCKYFLYLKNFYHELESSLVHELKVVDLDSYMVSILSELRSFFGKEE